MKNKSIEYAHIYTNSKIDQEHELSLKELSNIYENGDSLVVMVDDYSFPDPTFDYESFANWLSEKGYKPNVVIRESQLIPLCDQVISLIENTELKDELIKYVQSKKYPCSLFIASWYLVRLGKIQNSIFPEQEYAHALVNILPESFKPFEEKAFEIIKHTQYSEVLTCITNHYIQGREIK